MDANRLCEFVLFYVFLTFVIQIRRRFFCFLGSGFYWDVFFKKNCPAGLESAATACDHGDTKKKQWPWPWLDQRFWSSKKSPQAKVRLKSRSFFNYCLCAYLQYFRVAAKPTSVASSLDVASRPPCDDDQNISTHINWEEKYLQYFRVSPKYCQSAYVYVWSPIHLPHLSPCIAGCRTF